MDVVVAVAVVMVVVVVVAGVGDAVQEETYLSEGDRTSSSVADTGDTERNRAGLGGTP